MNIYRIHNVHFSIALLFIAATFFIGTYLIISEYNLFFIENKSDQSEINIFIKYLENIKDNNILNTILQKYNNSARDLIKEENEMINHRMRWMLTLNGLLFTTLGFSWGKNRVLNWLPWILSGVGAMSALSFGFVLQTSIKSIECTNELWYTISKFSEHPILPIIGRSKYDIVFWSTPLLPWRCLPLLLYAAWLIVALIIAVEKRDRDKRQHFTCM